MKHQSAIAVLEIALEAAESNLPIHKTEGNEEQAALCEQKAKDLKASIDFLKTDSE